MEAKLCKNCAEEVTRKFCANCGQKSDTHRITIHHFFMHDLLHGGWHLERGILFTLKEVIVRPGKAALDYIGGKRIRYYNVFYLCLLTIGLHILLIHFYDLINPERIKDYDNDNEINAFFAKHIKFVLLAVVPVMAINASVIFKRLKLNLAEHFIVSGFNLLGMLLTAIFFFFLNFANGLDTPAFVGILEVILACLIVFYPFRTYYNITKGSYQFMGLLWRIVLLNLLFYLQVLLLLSLIFLIVTNDSDVRISL